MNTDFRDYVNELIEGGRLSFEILDAGVWLDGGEVIERLEVRLGVSEGWIDSLCEILQRSPGVLMDDDCRYFWDGTGVGARPVFCVRCGICSFVGEILENGLCGRCAVRVSEVELKRG